MKKKEEKIPKASPAAEKKAARKKKNEKPTDKDTLRSASVVRGLG